MRKKIFGFLIVLLLILTSISLSSSVTGFHKFAKKDNLSNEDSINAASLKDWWSSKNHDPANTGYSTSTAPETNQVRWTYDFGDGRFPKTPVIVDNKVYCTSTGGYGNYDHSIVCLDADTGAIIWSEKPHFYCVNPSSVTVSYGNVYFYGDSFEVSNNKLQFNFYCYDADTGEEKWNFIDFAGDICGDESPLVVDGRIYIGSTTLYCFDAFSGEVIWTYDVNEIFGISDGIAYFDDNIYFHTFENSGPGKLYCLDANNGELIWIYEVDTLDSGGPVVANGKVYFKSDSFTATCCNAYDGSWIWTFEVNDRITSPFAVAYGQVYIGSDDNNLYCIDAVSGELNWKYLTDDSILNSPSVADGKVYFGSYDNYVYCVDADIGNLIWRHKTGHDINYHGSPAIADGKLYVGSGDDKLYCFDDNNPPRMNNPPDNPDIVGPDSGSVNEEYSYTISTSDIDGDDVYYFVEWDTGSITDNTGWIGPYSSGEHITLDHAWKDQGGFVIKLQVMDIYGERSDWVTYTVTMPRYISIYTGFLDRLLNNFPVLKTIFSNIN